MPASFAPHKLAINSLRRGITALSIAYLVSISPSFVSEIAFIPPTVSGPAVSALSNPITPTSLVNDPPTTSLGATLNDGPFKIALDQPISSTVPSYSAGAITASPLIDTSAALQRVTLLGDGLFKSPSPSLAAYSQGTMLGQPISAAGPSFSTSASSLIDDNLTAPAGVAPSDRLFKTASFSGPAIAKGACSSRPLSSTVPSYSAASSRHHH